METNIETKRKGNSFRWLRSDRQDDCLVDAGIAFFQFDLVEKIRPVAEISIKQPEYFKGNEKQENNKKGQVELKKTIEVSSVTSGKSALAFQLSTQTEQL